MTYYDLNMNSKRINNTQDPASAQDVATKNYVDARVPLIVSTPVLNPTILNSTLPTNTETVVTSVTATIDSSGVYQVFGNLAVQSNANTMTYGSLYCSTQSTPLPAPGPSRTAVVTALSYNQNFAGIGVNIHKQFQGSAIVAGTQLGRASGSGSGTVTLYLIGATQTQSGVAQGPDGNGLCPANKMATYYDLNMNSKRINNCQDPSAAQDVATKNYVDTSPVFNKAISGTTISTLQNCGNTAVYIDLATVGPSVTITTGTTAIISISTTVQESANDTTQAWMSFAVSGASSLPASDSNSITCSMTSISGVFGSISRTMKITGLTAGSNTFTAKYKATCPGSGVIQFSNRDLVVFP